MKFHNCLHANIHILFLLRRKFGWTDDNTVTKTLANLWVIFQPILFGLIGTEIQVSELDRKTVSLGIAVLVIGLSFRVVVTYLVVHGGDLNLKERIFVALAWLPKGNLLVYFCLILLLLQSKLLSIRGFGKSFTSCIRYSILYSF